jgi:ribosomal protein S18 acetylase RimI-like enzyme
MESRRFVKALDAAAELYVAAALSRHACELILFGERQNGDVSLRPANDDDALPVTALVRAAYERYVERIGMLPGPMTEDYARVIRNRQVTVAEVDGTIAGVIVLGVDDEGFVVENVAVHPSQQGKGLGRALLELAETAAARQGFDAIHLYTHEQMTENQALYSRLGYAEYDRRSQEGFPRVFMRKSLA